MSKSKFTFKKRSPLTWGILVTCFILSSLSLCWILYALLGHKIIYDAYHGQSIALFNRMIGGQSVHSLQHYLQLSDSVMRRATYWALTSSILLLVLLWLQRQLGTGVLVFNLVTSMVLLESVFELGLSIPSLFNHGPKGFRDHFIELHKQSEIRLIQFEPECSQYDANFGYLLKPGGCIFSNREFHNLFFVNSLGLRDEEASLLAPSIICLGDSHTMGWGVEQSETFADILERRTQLTVLNAGVSSFGTVREMRLLDKVDTSNLKFLVIQYTDNDYEENKEFCDKGNSLPAMTQQKYESAMKNLHSRQAHYPGKHTVESVRLLRENILNRFTPAAQSSNRPRDEADLFLNALVYGSHADLGTVQIIVLEVNSHGKNDRTFLGSLKEKMLSGNYPRSIDKLQLLDLSTLLHPRKHYYNLDPHPNAKGHEVIANAIFEMITRSPGPRIKVPTG